MDPAALNEAQKMEIEMLLLAGEESQGSIARKFGCSVTTIHRIAKKAGISSNITATNKAVEAKRDYEQAHRLQLLNKYFDKAEAMVDDEKITPSQFQSLVMSLAVLIDKRRLEDGEATNRSEVNTGATRELLASRIAALNPRRGTEAGTKRPH